MIRLLLTLFLCLTAATVQARCTGSDLRARLTPQYQDRLKTEVAKVPFAYGNHWVATKDMRTIHVVGTQHSGDSRMKAIMRRLKPIITSADAVLLEVTSHQSETLKTKLRKNPSLVFLKKDQSLPRMMSPEAWQALRINAAAIDLTAQEAARLQPWVLSIYLGRSGCGGRGFLSYAGLDDRIERMAIRNRVAIGSLEDVTAGFRALSMQPLPDQLRLLELDLTSEMNFDDLMVTLSDSYFNGSLAEARIIQEWVMYDDIDISRKEVARLLRQLDDQILDRRNRAWIPVIERTQANTLVVAVGAAHLPGRAGLLNLLKDKGYTLKRADK